MQGGGVDKGGGPCLHRTIQLLVTPPSKILYMPIVSLPPRSQTHPMPPSPTIPLLPPLSSLSLSLLSPPPIPTPRSYLPRLPKFPYPALLTQILSNAFRKERLYTEGVDLLLTER